MCQVSQCFLKGQKERLKKSFVANEKFSMQEKSSLLYVFLNKGRKLITKYEGILQVLTHLNPQKASKTLKIWMKFRRDELRSTRTYF